jgi:hypothetical protein
MKVYTPAGYFENRPLFSNLLDVVMGVNRQMYRFHNNGITVPYKLRITEEETMIDGEHCVGYRFTFKETGFTVLLMVESYIVTDNVPHPQFSLRMSAVEALPVIARKVPGLGMVGVSVFDTTRPPDHMFTMEEREYIHNVILDYLYEGKTPADIRRENSPLKLVTNNS